MEQFKKDLAAISEQLASINRKLDAQEPEELLTANGVMHLLKISRATFNRLKRDGKIMVYKLQGGKLLAKRSEILAALNNGLLEAPNKKKILVA